MPPAAEMQARRSRLSGPTHATPLPVSPPGDGGNTSSLLPAGFYEEMFLWAARTQRAGFSAPGSGGAGGGA